MRATRRYLDWFLGALAAGVALRVLLRSDRRPQEASPRGEHGGPLPRRKQWAGSLARTIRSEIRSDETVVISAALAFYAMLALVPAMIAAWSIYGLVLDTESLGDQIAAITNALPASAETLVADQVKSLTEITATGLSISLIVSVITALWVASSGTRSLLHGINLVYNVEERRTWLLQRFIAYGLTLGFIIFAVGSVALVTFLPGWLEDLGFGTTGREIVEIARWPGIFTIVVAGLTVLYRIGPNRRRIRKPVLFPGAAGAAVLWTIATAGFSFYAGSGLTSLSETYGTLLGVAVLLLWFFVSGFSILLGAEVNARLESQRRA